MIYSCEELQKMMEEVMEKVKIKMLEKNTTEELDEYLESIGCAKCQEIEKGYYIYDKRNSKLLVVGCRSIKKRVIEYIVKKVGLKPQNIDYLEYDEAKRYEFSRLEGCSQYSDIFFGPVPHSTSGKDDYSNIILKLEANKDKYPKIHVLKDEHSLKITKNSFTKALLESDFLRKAS